MCSEGTIDGSRRISMAWLDVNERRKHREERSIPTRAVRRGQQWILQTGNGHHQIPTVAFPASLHLPIPSGPRCGLSIFGSHDGVNQHGVHEQRSSPLGHPKPAAKEEEVSFHANS